MCALACFHLAMAVEIGEGGVHVVVGLAAEELERIVLRAFPPARFGGRDKGGQRVEALGGEGLGVELDFAGGRGQRAGDVGLEGMRVGFAMEGERDVAFALEVVEGDVLHAGIGGVAGGVDGESLLDDLLGRVAEGVFGEAHALGEIRKEAHVGAGFAGRLDSLRGELDEVVAVGALNVGVFEEGGGGQNVVGVVGGVVEEEIVDDGEEVVAEEAALDGVVVGSDGAGIGVVDEERVDARAVFRI